MSKTKNSVAVFTTVYPEGVNYLPDWYRSILAQTDCDFDLWIGCDRISVCDAKEAMGGEINAKWTVKEKEESGIHLRERMIREIIEDYSTVIFVDSDDILMPSRVETAKDALEVCDFYGCSMTLIDESGLELNREFRPPDGYDISGLPVRNNIFGLSNTAYRSNVLVKCLPFPENCILLDWFLATRALNSDATPYFDSEIRMQYRQHSLNTARVVPPFSGEQILLSTKRVLDHYRCILFHIPELKMEYKEKVTLAQKEVQIFYELISDSEDLLHRYVHTLNALPVQHIWWSCVANPQLEELWKN